MLSRQLHIILKCLCYSPTCSDGSHTTQTRLGCVASTATTHANTLSWDALMQSLTKRIPNSCDAQSHNTYRSLQTHEYILVPTFTHLDTVVHILYTCTHLHGTCSTPWYRLVRTGTLVYSCTHTCTDMCLPLPTSTQELSTHRYTLVTHLLHTGIQLYTHMYTLVNTYTCTHLCTHTCTHTCTHSSLYTVAYTCKHNCIQLCPLVQPNTHLHTLVHTDTHYCNALKRIFAHLRMCTIVHTGMPGYTLCRHCVDTYTTVHTGTHVYTHVHTDKHFCIHLYTLTNAFVHTFRLKCTHLYTVDQGHSDTHSYTTIHTSTHLQLLCKYLHWYKLVHTYRYTHLARYTLVHSDTLIQTCT